MQEQYAAAAGDDKVGNNAELAAAAAAAEQLQVEAEETRERTFAEAIVSRACAKAMWTLVEKRQRRNALEEEARQREVAAELRHTQQNRDEMMVKSIAAVVLKNAGLKAHQRHVKK